MDRIVLLGNWPEGQPGEDFKQIFENSLPYLMCLTCVTCVPMCLAFPAPISINKKIKMKLLARGLVKLMYLGSFLNS